MKIATIGFVFTLLCYTAFAQDKVEVRIISTIEQSTSLGRSRLLTQDKSGRLLELGLDNFEGIGGIKVGNIDANNRTISAKIAEMYTDGWELSQAVATVAELRTFTRYIFIRKKIVAP